MKKKKKKKNKQKLENRGGGGGGATYIQYSRGREFILLKAHLLLRPEEAIANTMVADPKHLLPLQIRIIAVQLRVILFMFCANERAERRR
jgi:hypothetical protein